MTAHRNVETSSVNMEAETLKVARDYWMNRANKAEAAIANAEKRKQETRRESALKRGQEFLALYEKQRLRQKQAAAEKGGKQ